MYLPDREIERVAVSMIVEFGADAEREADSYAGSASRHGLGTTAFIWEQVRQRIEKLNGGETSDVLEAA